MTDLITPLYKSLNLPLPAKGQKLPADFNALTKKVDGNTDTNHDGKIDQTDKNGWVEPEELFEEIFSHRENYQPVIAELQQAGLEDPFEERLEIKAHLKALFDKYPAKTEMYKTLTIISSIIPPGSSFIIENYMARGLAAEDGGLNIKINTDLEHPLRKKLGDLLPKEILSQPADQRIAYCLEESFFLASFLRQAGIKAGIVLLPEHALISAEINNKKYALDLNQFCALGSVPPNLVLTDREAIAAHYINETGFFSEPQIIIDKIDTALSLNPNSAIAWKIKADVYLDLNNLNEAAGHIKKALELKPDYPEALNTQGCLFLEQGRINESLKCFDRAIGLKNDLAAAWFNKGRALVFLKKFDEAQKSFDQALKLDPSSANAWFHKGSVYRSQMKLAEAKACFEKALSLKPNFTRALLRLGSIYFYEKNFEKARECFDKAVASDPKNAFAWRIKGDAFYSLKKLPEALACYEQVLKLEPNSKEAWLKKGQILFEQGKKEEAEECLRKAR